MKVLLRYSEDTKTGVKRFDGSSGHTNYHSDDGEKWEELQFGDVMKKHIKVVMENWGPRERREPE